MSYQNNIPQLRFAGFVGEWESNKMKEMAQFKAGYAFKSEQMLSKKSNYQLLKMSNVYQNELRLDRNPSFWKTIDAKQKEFLLKKGDSILTLTGTVGKKDYGYSIKIEDDNKFLLNQRLVLLREIQNKSDNSFISYLISNERFLFYFFAEAKGGTGNQTNVSTEDVKNIKLNFPTLPEQQKIASFLSVVDEKIQQLSRKKELLSQYKKGVMQQLFSGKLRFKDENGKDYADWDEKKLGGLAKITTGKLDANAMVHDGEYRFYTCAKDYYRIDKFAFDTEALLISGNGANVGYIHYYKGKFNAYQRTYVLDRIKEDIFYLKFYLDNFLYERIYTEKKEGNTPYIVMSTLSEMEILLPSLQEQQKIANFLSSIDTKIESTSQQLNQTQSFKKGLLQQLFV